MIELRLLAAPFDEPFIAELLALAERVFGAYDGAARLHVDRNRRARRQRPMLALNLQVGFRVIGLYQRTGTARVTLLKDLG